MSFSNREAHQEAVQVAEVQVVVVQEEEDTFLEAHQIQVVLAVEEVDVGWETVEEALLLPALPEAVV